MRSDRVVATCIFRKLDGTTLFFRGGGEEKSVAEREIGSVEPINIFASVSGGISSMFQRRPRLSLDKCQVLSPGANLQLEGLLLAALLDHLVEI